MKIYKLDQLLVVTVFTVSTLIGCSGGDKRKDERSATDATQFSKMDYDSMRAYFVKDSAFIARLNDAMAAEDAEAGKLKQLLVTEYESRNETGLTDTEINSAILSYNASKQVREKFSNIKKQLPKPEENAETIRRRTDSIVSAIETMKSKLKPSTVVSDSSDR